MIKLRSLMMEAFDQDHERFRDPLRAYMKKIFPKEYDPKQLLMFGLTLDDLIDVFINKILSLKVNYEFTRHGEDGYLPNAHYDAAADEITVSNIDYHRAMSVNGHMYASFVDSVIYHELVHALDYHRKLYDKVAYDVLIMGEKYYSDPEEIRAYSSQIKDYLVGHLGFSRTQAEMMMNRYTSDRSDVRSKWVKKYYDLGEGMEYPLAKGDDEQVYAGYAGWKGKIVWMSPDRFLELAYPMSSPSPYSLEDLEKKMKANHPIDALMLMIDPQRRKVTTHNGRHRATVAKKLGIEKVPVLIMAHIWDKRVPQWTKAQHDFIDTADFKPEKPPDEPID